MKFQPLPVGIDDFGDLIKNGYYYVDKSLFIKELLDMKGKVNLFTRPRRFGKTMIMSMLKYFFEDTGSTNVNVQNQQLFKNLKIMDQGEIYRGQMGRYPVISLSLKSSKQTDWKLAYSCLKEDIAREYRRHEAVLMLLPESDASKYRSLMERGAFLEDYITAIRFLSDCLGRAYGKNVVILIDEYDVPLENAYFSGFYEEMSGFIRSLLESALKSNPYLEFAVVTGCLRITKESIFTGLNNLEIHSILSAAYDEYFGFSREELGLMLEHYSLMDKGEVFQQWYDGYCFGNQEVYNPWSVVNYVKALCIDKEALPAPYWANTSSNSIVRELIEKADLAVRAEIENLIEGGTIEKVITEDITYEDIYHSEENLWNFLFFTGYLKMIAKRMEGLNQVVTMAIPNREVSYIYRSTVLDWFKGRIGKIEFSHLYAAVEQADTEAMEKEISENLQETISFYDYGENYYHGFLAGILKNMKKYVVLSNREAGTGRADLLIKTPSVRGLAIVMELKVVKRFDEMEEGCRRALEQIENRGYERILRAEGYTKIIKYGICFYRKECKVMAERVKAEKSLTK